MVEPFLARALAASMAAASWDDARLTLVGPPGLVSVRARDDGAIRLARAIDQAVLPAPNECRRTQRGYCYWLRPDEWLFTADPEAVGALISELDASVGDDDGAVVDVSGSRVLLELAGSATRDVLASCCPLDLHPTVFTPGRCAQSLIAKAPVLVHLGDDLPRWRIFTAASHADYVARWLVDGMEGVRAESVQ